MRIYSVFRLVGAALLSLMSVAGCRFERPESNPAVLAAPASPDDSPEATRETVVRAARSDLQCGEAAIAMTMDRRYANGSALRFIVDGCGRRALYAESCEEYPICRYLLVSVIPVPVYGGSPAPGPAPTLAPSASTGSPWPPAGAWPSASGSSSVVPAPSAPPAPSGSGAPSAPSAAPSAPRLPGASAPPSSSASVVSAPVSAPPAKPTGLGTPLSL